MWVDISIEKPMEGQAILVWVDKPQSPPNVRAAIYYEWRSYSDGVLTAKGDSFMGVCWENSKKVTHWQPLTVKKPKVRKVTLSIEQEQK